MSAAELTATVRALLAPGKGILAADESHPSIEKRFNSINLKNSETARRDYRDMLLTAPGIAEYISGVIFYDETIRQAGVDGRKFVELLKSKGIVPGIKVDLGAKDLPGFPGEKITEGLDGLAARLDEYYALGARFAKWRAVIEIDTAKALPTESCLRSNAEALARYAALCQASKIVPIVEPEVIMDGAHSLEDCTHATERALRHLFDALAAHRVLLEGIILKPNMVVPGTECKQQASVEAVAHATVRTFLRTVPAAVPGIAFLSGGQSDELATAHLNAMNAHYPSLPWGLTFSYGRALQAPALKAWAGKADNVEAGRRAFAHRARMNSAARFGKYTAAMEKDAR